MEVVPLFSTASMKEDQANVPTKFESEDTSHEFCISKSYREFAMLLDALEQNKSYHFISFGQYSLKHVVFHLISIIGKCHIWSTTYGLGPISARGIVKGLDNGAISSFNFLYDWKIRTYKEEAHFVCENRFPVKLTSIHAKVTVLLNEEWGITISGSANWSDTNKKIECITVSTNKDLALFHKKWIDAAIKCESSEPANILNEINL
jgi:hypothetical protein